MERGFFRFMKLSLIDSMRGGTSLIYLGILGTFILGAIYQLMQTHDVNLTSDRAFTQNIEVDMFMEEAKIYLRTKAACKSSFGGKSLGDSADHIQFYGLQGTTYTADTAKRLNVGEPVPVFMSQLTVDSIKIVPPTAGWLSTFRATPYMPSSRMFTYFAQFTFTKGSIISLRGRSEIVRFLPIEVALRPDGTIETCYFDSDSSVSRWVFDSCLQLFGGTIMQGQCADVNIKSSLSTDGHYCFNKLDGNDYTPGVMHEKDCANSWYFQTRSTSDCHLLPPDKVLKCDNDEVMIGFTSYNCGKNCVKASGLCCKIRLAR